MNAIDKLPPARIRRPRASRIGSALSAVVLAAAVAAAPARTSAQVNVSGQASASFLRSGPAATQYSFDRGRGTFGWRADLFFDAAITDDVLFLSNVRMMQDAELHVDLFVLRLTSLAGPALNLEAGLLDVPFGNLGDRRFPKANPFISLPLGREHRTSLRSSDYGLWMADARYSAAGNGVRLVDGALYDAGVKAYGTIGMFDYAVALVNGAVSATGSYAPGGINDNHGFGQAVRLALTPSTGFTVGISGARGPFISGSAASYYGSSYTGGHDPAAHLQQIAGIDVEYAYEHFTFYAEGFLNRWEFSDEYGADLDAAAISAELRFVPATRISLAARVGAISFSELPAAGDPGYYGTIPGTPWDRDVLRIEGAAGYRISREVLLKAVYQRVNTVGLGDDPSDDTAAIQVVASF